MPHFSAHPLLLFTPPADQGALEQRISRAVESLLENEGLTADLDDQAANDLLAWGTALTRQVVAPTADLTPEAADAALEPQLQALRRFLRLVGKWAAQAPTAPEAQANHLDKVLEQATRFLGAGLSLPDPERRKMFLAQVVPPSSPIEFIRRLRQGLENLNTPPAATVDESLTPGDSHDQEAYV